MRRRRLLDGDEVFDAVVGGGGDEAGVVELLDAAEGAVALAVLEDPAGERGADAGEGVELSRGGRVEVQMFNSPAG